MGGSRSSQDSREKFPRTNAVHAVRLPQVQKIVVVGNQELGPRGHRRGKDRIVFGIASHGGAHVRIVHQHGSAFEPIEPVSPVHVAPTGIGRVSSRIVARAVAAEVTRRKCFSR